jgi:hypothetical protein
MSSLLERFRKLVPGVAFHQYIEFFSLKSCGAINNKVFTDQVLVNSKVGNLMECDDCEH